MPTIEICHRILMME
jgi:hypothetical protein